MAKEGWQKGEGEYSKSHPTINSYTGVSGPQDGGGGQSKGKPIEPLVDTNGGEDNGYSGRLNGKY